LKNHWDWGGFTTQDLKRCRLLARSVALIYNWWSLFVRLADPDHHRDVITSRPLLLQAMARQTQHAGQTDRQQYARRAAQNASCLPAHCCLLRQLAANNGAVGSGAAMVSHPQRSSPPLPARPPTHSAGTPRTGVNRKLWLQTRTHK